MLLFYVLAAWVVVGGRLARGWAAVIESRFPGYCFVIKFDSIKTAATKANTFVRKLILCWCVMIPLFVLNHAQILFFCR